MHLSGLDFLAMSVPLAAVLFVTLLMRRYVRSVADFLAANRCAGRYVISTALTGTSSVMGLCVALEVFSKAGFSLGFWSGFTGLIGFFFGLLGLVSYRFRETRALTFHQFFEVRYSKQTRIFASFLNVFSGLFNFGLEPAVGARFFVYFCGLPHDLHVAGLTVPTFIPIMLALMTASLCFAISGGQISVMVTDCIEGVISSIFYLIIAVFILCTISYAQMHAALLSGPPGKSFVDPFDIGGRADLNGWYVIASMIIGLLYYRGNVWAGAFGASARNAHEIRMAGILSNWRGLNYASMSVLVAIAGFVLLHHVDFAGTAAQVDTTLQAIPGQLQTQMRMPTALGFLLAPGIRGCFLGVLLFGLLASQGMQLHSFGATLLQDVILPQRKAPMSPKAHVWALRASILFVALFTVTFSAFFKPVEILQFITQLIGVIYLGGIGLVVWGGLYWKRGTTAGAMTALVLGGTLGVAGNVIQNGWKTFAPWLATHLPAGALSAYLQQHAAQCPMNGILMSLSVSLICAVSYVAVSLLTSREPFDLDAMLHRGAHRLAGEEPAGAAAAQPAQQVRRPWLDRLLSMDENFTRNDRILTVGTFAYTVFFKILALGILGWTLLVGRLSPSWWFGYHIITGVWLAVSLAAIVAVWFTIGVVRDLRYLFHALATAQRNAEDDGTVRGHHNAGEGAPVENERAGG